MKSILSRYFRTIRVFEISVSCGTVAWQRITFSSGNARPWYFQKIIFKYIDTALAGGISTFHNFVLPKSDPKVAKVHIVQVHSCAQLPLLMQFLYGVTTLRDTCNAIYIFHNLRPAVNRQPGYRRVDPESGFKTPNMTETTKTNANFKITPPQAHA